MLEKSYNKKIMRWDGIRFQNLVENITDAEMLEMLDWMENNFPWLHPDEFRDDIGFWEKSKIVYSYMKWWLYSCIDEGEQAGTHELFENVMCALPEQQSKKILGKSDF